MEGQEEHALGRPSGPVLAPGTPVAGLAGVRTTGGDLVDLVVADGRVTHVTPHAAGHRAPAALDATGWLALPAMVEPHAHLDKALSAPQVTMGDGHDLPAAVACWRGFAADLDAGDLARRARATLRRYVANGITAVRSHVDLPGGDDPFRALDALLAVRGELADGITLQLCTLSGPDTPDEVVVEAHRRGADVVGGCPHLAPDPAAATRRALDLAERLGLPLDLHTDERTDTDGLDLLDLAEELLARGLADGVPAGPQPVAGTVARGGSGQTQGRPTTHGVTASHVVRLGSLAPDALAHVLSRSVEAGVAMVTLPITNLYLQGRGGQVPAPRGLPPLRALLAAGVTLAGGGDNVRDPFNPVGRADPLETTALLVAAGHLSAEQALHAVTDAGRAVLGMPRAGTRVGDVADLLLVPDQPLGDVVAGVPGSRVVLAGGRVVADTRVTHASGALPRPTSGAAPPRSTTRHLVPPAAADLVRSP